MSAKIEGLTGGIAATVVIIVVLIIVIIYLATKDSTAMMCGSGSVLEQIKKIGQPLKMEEIRKKCLRKDYCFPGEKGNREYTAAGIRECNGTRWFVPSMSQRNTYNIPKQIEKMAQTRVNHVVKMLDVLNDVTTRSTRSLARLPVTTDILTQLYVRYPAKLHKDLQRKIPNLFIGAPDMMTVVAFPVHVSDKLFAKEYFGIFRCTCKYINLAALKGYQLYIDVPIGAEITYKVVTGSPFNDVTLPKYLEFNFYWTNLVIAQIGKYIVEREKSFEEVLEFLELPVLVQSFPAYVQTLRGVNVVAHTTAYETKRFYLSFLLKEISSVYNVEIPLNDSEIQEPICKQFR